MLRILLLVSGLFFLNSINLFGQTANPDYLDGVVFMKINPSATITLTPYDQSDLDFNQIIQAYEITDILNPFSGIGSDTLDLTYKLHFDDTLGVNQMITEIENLSWVDYCEKAPLIKTTYTPNDAHTNQWYLSKIDAFSGWSHTKGSSDVVIAIVDNAVRITHSDLVDNLWVNPGEVENGLDSDLNGYPDDIHGYDVADNNNNPNPPSSFTSGAFSHGSHCAGTASATTDNSNGVAGIGFDCKIMAVKCTPDNSDGATLPFAYEGLKYAVDANADIVSMSWGSKVPSFTGDALLSAANLQGITMFAAAGNDNEENIYSPASHQNVMAVGATNENDERASFSNYGEEIAFMAPGVSIYNLLGGNDDDYGYSNGTSMACPIAAGIGGLVLSMHPNYSPNDIKNAISVGCDDIESLNPNYSGKLGAGRVNIGNIFESVSLSNHTNDVGSIRSFPNPASDYLIITSNKELIGEIDVFDNIGKSVKGKLSINNITNSKELKIEQLSRLEKGIYYVKLKELNEVVKFVVE